MEDLQTVTTFLGWCSIINVGLFTYAAIMVIVFNSLIKKLHSKLLHIAPDRLNELYFKFLGHYKLAIIVFNLVPYCALKIMT
jgi:hypothetical protein